MSKVRHWWIQKPTSNNCPCAINGAVFEDFVPKTHKPNHEWIKVISLDDLRNKLKNEDSEEPYDSLQRENDLLKKQVEKLKALILFTDPVLSSEQCGERIQLIQWNEFIKCFPEEGEE